MSRIYSSLTELIGHTPLLELTTITSRYGLKAKIVAKLESFNPGGSIKDRAALNMIEDAEQKGLLKPGAVIIEPTSGNTGVGLAWVGGRKGYKTILTMPETMSRERQTLLKALGAQIVLTPGSEGMSGAIRKAEALKAELPDAVILQQFENPANPAAHVRTTAEEIWNDTDGQVDVFVSAVGTGGTIVGTAEGLKKHNPAIEIVAVEPADSAVLSGGVAGPHKIQGIGAGFVPKIFRRELVDRIMTVSNDDAMRMGRALSVEEGILAGISSGAALQAAVELAREERYTGKMIVVILPDTGERYLSTDLYAFEDSSL